MHQQGRARSGRVTSVRKRTRKVSQRDTINAWTDIQEKKNIHERGKWSCLRIRVDGYHHGPSLCSDRSWRRDGVHKQLLYNHPNVVAAVPVLDMVNMAVLNHRFILLQMHHSLREMQTAQQSNIGGLFPLVACSDHRPYIAIILRESNQDSFVHMVHYLTPWFAKDTSPINNRSQLLFAWHLIDSQLLQGLASNGDQTKL